MPSPRKEGFPVHDALVAPGLETLAAPAWMNWINGNEKPYQVAYDWRLAQLSESRFEPMTV